MRRTIPFVVSSWILSAALASAAPQAPANQQPVVAPGEAQAVTEQVAPANPAEFQYGPILAKDPEVRAQIKKLYRDQSDLEKATAARLEELKTALSSEADADLKVQIQRDMMAAKKSLMIDSMQLGLEIAKLNEDLVRVAEYEKAIDLALHPEKNMPQTLDPSIAQERARQLGLEK